MNLQDSMTAIRGQRAGLAAKGVHIDCVQAYVPDGFGLDFNLAMDAQPQLQTTASAGVPALLTSMIDPKVFRILFTPNKAAELLGEQKKGTWLDQTAFFPVIEAVGEVTSYGDFNENGHVGANLGFPQRQNYLFQTIKEYGQLELERAGLAKVNWVAEIDAAAATVINKFLNNSYFFGIAGIQNYGILNDPNLPASLTPALKAYGGTKWIVNGVVQATANEVFSDIAAVIGKLITQTGGLVTQEDKFVFVLSPGASLALNQTNSFGVNVKALLKTNFPNIRLETAVQYGALSASNPVGIAGGEFMQIFAESIDGQETGYGAFSEKMRMHAMVTQLSSWKQKISAGTWGAIIRLPIAFASMVGL